MRPPIHKPNHIHRSGHHQMVAGRVMMQQRTAAHPRMLQHSLNGGRGITRCRNHLMVATADEAMARMLAGIRDGLRRHADPLKGMADYPNILWRIQNDLPARAHTEIQLASRWDAGPGEGLRKIVADMNDLVISKVQELASQTGLKDVPGLIREIYILISATQGMAINRNLSRDRTQANAALALLRERFVDALRERMQLN